MTKIKTYSNDSNITVDDQLLGSDAENTGATKNFKMQDFLAFLAAQGFGAGQSAYELAVEQGFEGDEAAWLASLVGAQGEQGEQGAQGEPGEDGGGLGYTRIIFDIDTSALTATSSIADHSGATFEITNPSNGVVRIIPTGVTFTNNKVKVPAYTINNGGQMYHIMPDYSLLPVWLDLNIVKFDGTMTSTPSVTIKKLEIQIYP